MQNKPALFYTSNKKYVIATIEDAENNSISQGYTVFQGCPAWIKHNLVNAIDILSKRINPDYTPYYKTIPFYKDIKQPNGEYKYTFIKNLIINK